MLWTDGFLWASFVFLQGTEGKCLAGIALQTYHIPTYFAWLSWSFRLIRVQAIVTIAFFFYSAGGSTQFVHVWTAILVSSSLVKFVVAFTIFPSPSSSYHRGSIDAVSPFLQIPCDIFRPRPYAPPSLVLSLPLPHLANLQHHALLLDSDCLKCQAVSPKTVSSSFTRLLSAILHLFIFDPSDPRLSFYFSQLQLPQDSSVSPNLKGSFLSKKMRPYNCPFPW